MLAFHVALHRIIVQLRLCGETITNKEQIDKILSTFPLASALLALQYRNMDFKTYAQLMSHLLLAEKQQQILLKDAETCLAVRETKTTEMAVERPKGTWWKPTFKANSRPQSHPKSRDKSFSNQHFSAKRHDKTSTPKDIRTCHNCGRTRHLAKDCKTNEYFVKMYKELQQLKS